VKLNRRGRALLKRSKHHRLNVTLSGTSKNSAGTASKLASRRLTLKGR
jgi:hypothetical protein